MIRTCLERDYSEAVPVGQDFVSGGGEPVAQPFLAPKLQTREVSTAAQSSNEVGIHKRNVSRSSTLVPGLLLPYIVSATAV